MFLQQVKLRNHGGKRMPKAEQKGVSLDELQSEAEKLLALLKDRHPGLLTWNQFMRDRLKSLQKLISQALEK